MADIFDKIISGVSKGMENVSTGSKLMVEKAKINTYIEQLEGEKQHLAGLLGAKVYNLYMEDKLCREEVESFCMEIRKRIQEIGVQRKKLQEMDAEKANMAAQAAPSNGLCKCGTQNAQGAKFCAKCGTTL